MNPIGYSKRNFLISVGFCVLVLGVLSALMVQGARSETGPSQQYRGPVYCSQCHKSEYMNWNNTAHAHAFDDPVFQSTWKAQGSPNACLECHTTGFDLQTGVFSTEEVTCEMCHGPGGTMNLNTTAAFCGKCHSFSHMPTYTEWLSSGHGHAGVDCVNCHDPMSYTLIEEPLKLCGQCHSDKVAELEAGTHGTKGYNCLNCHMVKSVTAVDGRVYNQTGHTFIAAPPSPDCKSCHKDLNGSHSMWGSSADDCLTCHNPVAMTQLHLLNGTAVSVSESSVLCRQCHNDKYYELKMGVHGDPHGEKNCTDCHKAMQWYIMMNATLPPMETSLSTSTTTQAGADIKLGGLDLGTLQFGTIFIIAFAAVGAVGLVVILRRI